MSTIKTDQEAFYFVRSHLLKQKDKSFDDTSETCFYRGFSQKELEALEAELKNSIQLQPNPDGDPYIDEVNNDIFYEAFAEAVSELNPDLKCAVGALIDDDNYSYLLEHQAIESSGDVVEAVRASNPDWNYSNSSQEMLMDLQLVHDQVEVNNWVTYLDRIEKRFDANGKYLTADNRSKEKENNNESN